MPTSVRLDEQTKRLLESLMRSTRKTQSEVIRDAIEALAQAERPTDVPAFAAVEDLIGCACGGPADLSENTGQKLRELLSAKKSARDRRDPR